MTSQHIIDRSGSGERSIMSGSTKWDASLASENQIQMDSHLNPAKCRTKGRRRVVTAFWIFLALLIILGSAATYLLWAKLNGSL
jgi:hypothetical protein